MPGARLQQLRDRYPAIAKDLIAPLVDVLTAGRMACGGDSDKFLIILIIALRTVEDKRFAALDPAQVQSGELESYPSLSTNVRSISDSTGIPKETVRRKVAALVEDGWVHRVDNNLALAPLASRMLGEAREPLLQLAARYQQLASEAGS